MRTQQYDLVHQNRRPSPYRNASHRITLCPDDSCDVNNRIRRNPHHANIPIVSLEPTNKRKQPKRNHWILSNSFFLSFIYLLYSHPIFNNSYNRSLPTPGIINTDPSARRLPHSFPFVAPLKPAGQHRDLPPILSGPFKARIHRSTLSPDVGFVLITSDQPCNVVRIISSTQILTL